MLRFVREVRPAILHLRDLRVGIVRVHPVFVRRLLPALAIQPRQGLTCRRLDPRGLGEPRQERLIALAGVTAHDAPHRGIGFQRRRVDRNRAAVQQASRDQSLLDPRKDGSMRVDIDQPASARDRRVVRRRLLEAESHEPANGQRIGRTPRDAAFRIETFEVADQQQPEIASRFQTRAPHGRGIESPTLVFRKPVDSLGIENRIQLGVERVTRRRGQVGRGDPQRRLLGLARAHGHTRHSSTPTTLARQTRQRLTTFTTDC